MKKNQNQKQEQKINEIALLKNQLAEAQTQKLRALADYQNLHKRVEIEKQEWVKYANTNLLSKILSVCDDLDRAANFIKDAGIDMVRNNLKNVLKEFGVEEIEMLGKDFDPNFMECVEQKEGQKNKVLQVLEKAYKLHDKILRPGKVIVGK